MGTENVSIDKFHDLRTDQLISIINSETETSDRVNVAGWQLELLVAAKLKTTLVKYIDEYTNAACSVVDCYVRLAALLKQSPVYKMTLGGRFDLPCGPVDPLLEKLQTRLVDMDKNILANEKAFDEIVYKERLAFGLTNRDKYKPPEEKPPTPEGPPEAPLKIVTTSRRTRRSRKD